MLDRKYYNPEVKDILTVDTINNHPILRWYLKKQSDE